MMPLEKQVVSLELAKKLKELKCKQESLFYWNTTTDKSDSWVINPAPSENCSYWNQVSAFTVAELGEMLPSWFASFLVNKDTPPLRGIVGQWRCEGGNPEHKKSGVTEADARAKMLIYLFENGLMGKERG